MAEIDEKIGLKIKEIRKSWGMSQIELAEKIGLSFQQVQKYEKGSTAMSVFRLQQISNALSVHVNTFFEEGEQTPEIFGPTFKYDSGKSTFTAPQPLTREEISFLKLLRKISNKKFRQGLLKQLKGVIELEKEK